MHTIDVGQGDSSLIIQGKTCMLIDAGTKAKGKDVVKYLQKIGIKKIDILIGTHPHDDHLGGMAEVIRNFDIGTLYTPEGSDKNVTTSWYMDFLSAISEKNVTCKNLKAGDKLKLGDAEVSVLAPRLDNYTNKNNYSIVTRITYGSTNILLTGDAEELSENEILNGGFDVRADVLKARSSRKRYVKLGKIPKRSKSQIRINFV